MTKIESRNARIRGVVDRTEGELRAEGVDFLLVAVDRQPKAKGGGTVHNAAKLSAENLTLVLKSIFPHPADVIELGLIVGRMVAECRETSPKQ